MANAGPIIHLSWIEKLDLFPALFDDVLVPSAVRDELLAAPAETIGREAIVDAFARKMLQIRAVNRIEYPGEEAFMKLDRGEQEAILLAEQDQPDVFLTDDAIARSVAVARGLRVMGTIGVLRVARDQGLIPAVAPHLLALRGFGQWISAGLVEMIRREEEE